MSHNYWLADAMLGNSEDALPFFLKYDYWYCWGAAENADTSSSESNVIQVQRERFAQIQEGDRIAIKKLLDPDSRKMEIRAIGIVRNANTEEWRVNVDWLPISPPAKKISRFVDLKDCTESIHGPFAEDDPWIRQVFCV